MRGGDSRGQGEGTKVKATKTSGRDWDASPSYNPFRDCNISSYYYYHWTLCKCQLINWRLFVISPSLSPSLFLSLSFSLYFIYWWLFVVSVRVDFYPAEELKVSENVFDRRPPPPPPFPSSQVYYIEKWFQFSITFYTHWKLANQAIHVFCLRNIWWVFLYINSVERQL